MKSIGGGRIIPSNTIGESNKPYKCTFNKASSPKRLIIEEGFTIIPMNELSGCIGLEEVILPKSLNTIDQGAFAYCEDLQKVTIRAKRAVIRKQAFYGCRSLNDINLPDGTISIGAEAFVFCSNLSHIELPDSLSIIGKGAFAYSGLRKVTLPDIDSFGSHVFQSCGLLESVTYKEEARVPECTFALCPKLEKVVFQKDVSFIGNMAFGGSGLKCFIFSGNCKIGDSVFKDCKGLHMVKVRDSINTDGANIFNGCDNLQCVEINPHTTIASSFFHSVSDKVTVIRRGIKLIPYLPAFDMRKLYKQYKALYNIYRGRATTFTFIASLNRLFKDKSISFPLELKIMIIALASENLHPAKSSNKKDIPTSVSDEVQKSLIDRKIGGSML